MKQGRGAGSLLILLETVVLAAVLILGVTRYASGADEKTARVVPVETTEQNDNRIIAETEETELTEAFAEAPQTVFTEEILTRVDGMSIEEKVAGLFLTTPESLTENDRVTVAGDGTRTALENYPVAGLVYSDQNFSGQRQFGSLLSGAQQYSAQAGSGYLILAAREASEDGSVRVAFSSVYDTEPLIALMQSGMMQGDEENLIYPATFPEGAEDIASDADYVLLSGSADEAATGDTELPCMFSSKAVQSLRNDHGYQGVIVSSDLAGAAEAYPDGQAAVKAVQAGVDLLFTTDGFATSYDAVLAAVNSDVIPVSRIEDALCRILTLKADMPEPTDGDILAAGEAENTDNAGDQAQE